MTCGQKFDLDLKKKIMILSLKEDDLITFKSQVEAVSNIEFANYEINLIGNQEGNDHIIPSQGLTLLHIAAFYDSIDCFCYLQKRKKLSLRIESASSL